MTTLFKRPVPEPAPVKPQAELIGGPRHETVYALNGEPPDELTFPCDPVYQRQSTGGVARYRRVCQHGGRWVYGWRP